MSAPTVASYCTTFLKKEMRHIYRQVGGLRRYRTFILTQERVNPDLYPFPDVIELPKPRVNLLVRAKQKFIDRVEPLLYRGEYGVLADALRAHPADLMHVYFGHTGVHLLPFIRRWDRPTVVSFHGVDVNPRSHDPRYFRRLREMFEIVPLVLARSDSLGRNLVDLGCPAEKIRINRTGIPFDAFPASVRTPPPDGAWRIIQASRLIDKKGLDDSLRAFAEFRASFPRAHFTMAGDGPDLGSLQILAGELGLAGAVDFTGFQSQEDLARLYGRSHIFLHPSRMAAGNDQEGIPNSMLEAMASGLPVVATLHGGIPEAVENGVTGLLFPERDPAALAGGLLRLAGEPGLMERLSERAAAAVRMEFSPGQQAARLESAYDEAVAIFSGGVTTSLS